MENNYFINEEGLNCYIMPCGCEGVEYPNIGWQTILCQEHEEEYDSLIDKPLIYKKTKMRPNREI